jgi:lipoate-protein ligase A
MNAFMMSWRLLIHNPLPPALALAVDEAIALRCTDHGGRATLRFYQWDRPAISIGRFQRVEHTVHTDLCRLAGLPVLRRITGGRAVWHDRELTYSLISPLPSPIFPASLTETVAVIGHALAGGLQRLGLPAQPSGVAPQRMRHTPARRSPFCFDAPAWHEVSVGGKKIIGSAQRRWRDRFLQQGSILLRYDAEAVARWLPVDSRDLQAAAGLNDVLPEPIETYRLAELLAGTFASTWGIELQPGSLTPEETALTERLAAEKYADAAWTMRGEARRSFDVGARAEAINRPPMPPPPK